VISNTDISVQQESALPQINKGGQKKLALGRFGAGTSGVVFALAIWQILSQVKVFPSQYLPSATAVITKIGSLLTMRSLWSMVGSTMEQWGLGLLVAIACAIPLGVLFGTNERSYRFARVVIEALRPIPPVVLIPIALLELGPSFGMSILLIVQGALWPLLLQSFYGVRSIDPVSIETARAFRISKWRSFFYIRLFGASPMIATGIRISATIALVVAVVAELIGGAAGIGNGILKAETSDAITLMYALIVVSGILGMGINLIFRGLERKTLFWHTSQH